MDYNEFINVVTNSVRDSLPGCEVTLREVVKNNNVVLSGLSIRSDEVNAAPTIYLEQFYEAYRDGDDIPSILGRIISIYEDNKLVDNYDFAFIEDYDTAKNNIYFKAVNLESNKKFLADVPYSEFRDLALVPYYLLDDEVFGDASVVIHNDLFEKWNIKKDDFYKDIMDNMENRFEYEFMPITDMLTRLSGGLLPDDMSCMGMYVLFPEHKLYGAALIAVCSVLGRIAEILESDYYIIPSSVHELIIVRSDDEEDEKLLNDMISEVNNTVVLPEDYLSDHAYFYKRGMGITR